MNRVVGIVNKIIGDTPVNYQENGLWNFRKKMFAKELQKKYSHPTGCQKRRYTKLIERNLKLVTSINIVKLLLDFTQSNLNFESLFVEICPVLREIWLFEREFQAKNFGQLRIFGGVKFVNKLFNLNRIYLFMLICFSLQI